MIDQPGLTDCATLTTGLSENSIVSIHTLQKFTDHPKQISNADLFIYIMSSETGFYKVMPFTKHALEQLTDYHYFTSLLNTDIKKHKGTKSLSCRQTHSVLGTRITHLNIPGVKVENVKKCLQFIKTCADEKMMSIYLLRSPKDRFESWIFDNLWIDRDKIWEDVIECYKIFDFLGSSDYVEVTQNYLIKIIRVTDVLKFERLPQNLKKECEKYFADLETRNLKLEFIHRKDETRIIELESGMTKLESENEFLKSAKSDDYREISSLKRQLTGRFCKNVTQMLKSG